MPGSLFDLMSLLCIAVYNRIVNNSEFAYTNVPLAQQISDFCNSYGTISFILAFGVLLVFLIPTVKIKRKSIINPIELMSISAILLCVDILFSYYLVTPYHLNEIKVWISLRASHTSLNDPLPIVILCHGIIIPIIEELIYRYHIQNLFSNFNEIFAIVATSVLFALMHVNLDGVVFGFISAIILGFIMYKTNNILYPIVIHCLLNTTAMIFAEYRLLSIIGISSILILTFILVIGLYIKGRIKREIVINTPINSADA